MARNAKISAPPHRLDDPPEPASIMLPAVALIGLGVTMIYSASATLDPASGTGDVGWRIWQDQGLKQILFVPPALIGMWLASRLPHTFWRLRGRRLLSPVVILLVVTVGLLLLIYLLPASITESKGARRWIKLAGGFTVQPSELAKVALVVMMAALLADPRFKARSFLSGVLPLIGLIALVTLPVIKEDFGTGALIGLVGFCILVAGGTKFWQPLLFIPPAAGVGAWFVLSAEYRLKRVMDFFGEGELHYHIQQSLMAIASGGWYGKGLGEGIQKFGYVPEDHTDFIFAVVCEELGVVGAGIVIGVFVMLLWQLRRAMVAAPDRLGQIIVLGVMLTIGFQAAMNIAVVGGFVPPKGIALPFVSAGGSGLIIMSVALGLAASVARGARRAKELG